MSLPLIVGANGISRLLTEGVALSPSGQSPFIKTTTSDLTSTNTFGWQSSLFLNNSTGKIFITSDIEGYTSELYPQFTAQVKTSAGALLTASTWTFIDFATTDNDTTSSFTGQGNGNSTTYTSTCRYVCPRDGIYYMAYVIEANVTAGCQHAFYKNGTIWQRGCTRPDTGTTGTTKRMVNEILSYYAANDEISVAANITVASPRLTATAANNRWSIWCLGDATGA